MGVDSKKKKASIPLPAPTETESTATTATDVATEVSQASQPLDEKSSYSLPEDGTPVTIKTRGHSASRSQTSLLIEYFEGGKTGSDSSRKPSVRVRLKPSSSRKSDHIMISKPKSTSHRKTSGSRRSTSGQKNAAAAAAAAADLESRSSIVSGDGEDDRSINSYASATEESNVSRNPIVVEIDRGGSAGASNQRQRPRRPTSPLIPTAVSSRNSTSYPTGTQSEISAIPADSFLDGSGSAGRSVSPSRALAAAAAGAAAVERNRVASGEKERAVVSKSSSRDRDRGGKSERRHRSSRSRPSSSHVVEKEETRSPSNKRSSRQRQHNESAVSGVSGISGISGASGAESSVVSSALSPSHRSYDQYSVRSGASKASSINNPKLLETVEDAIRRLILPELNALKREHSRKDRRGSTTSTGTSASRDEYTASDRRKSANSDKYASASKEASKLRDVRDREGRFAVGDSPSPSVGYDYDSGNDDASVSRSIDATPIRSADKLKTTVVAGAAGAALGGLAAAAVADNDGSPATARDQRRRRRAVEARTRDLSENRSVSPQQGPPDLYLSGSHSAASGSFEGNMQRGNLSDEPMSDVAQNRDAQKHLSADNSYLQPPMPLMSEINSEVTRTSILSADTDRPPSASEELQAAPVQEVSRGVASAGSGSTPTPTTTPGITIQSLGAQHANVSHGDLRALPRKGPADAGRVGNDDYYEADDFEHEQQQRMLQQQQQSQEYTGEDEYDEEYDDGQYGNQTYDAYGHQIVPAPLKYVPYQPEHRGLSPIPSVSGFTEGGASEVQGRRDSGLTATTSPSPTKSPLLDRRLAVSPSSSIPSNVMSRDFDDNSASARSSEIDYIATSARAGDFRAIDGVGANPNIVHTPVGVESAVASLVDGSMLDGSALTGNSSANGVYNQAHARGSMDTLEEEMSHGRATPQDASLATGHQALETGRGHEVPREVSSASPVSPVTTRTNPSEFAGEYEIDQYGRKVRRASPTASEAAAITAGAVGLAIQAARDRNQQPRQSAGSVTREVSTEYADEWVPEGVQRNKSFKERTLDGRHPASSPTYSADRLDEYDQPQMMASGLPDMKDPLPEIGYGYEDDDLETNPSVVHGRAIEHDGDDWRAGDRTPTQEHHDEAARSVGMSGMAAGGAAAVASSQHSRQTSQDRDDEWPRSSDDRKRDTLITNPYEGTSPVVNEDLIKTTLPTASGTAAAVAAAAAYGAAADYTSRSPLGARYDEGYISQGPGKSPDMTGAAKGKGIDFAEPAPVGYGAQEDPFYGDTQVRHFSGMSHGMATPIYDASTGAGIDRIENKDIIALMQHLMVRDAQRSARDTEILVTLVRAAAEMRTSFENVRTMLAMHEKGINNEFSKKMADSEDAIITEILDGTEKSIRTHLGGPRPLPGSGARSLNAGGSQADMDDTPAKRQNIFRRALKSLNAKGNSDLGRIEDMLNQLLLQVDELKMQTNAPGVGGLSVSGSATGHRPSPYDGMIESQMQQYEQDRGYEPEGHAGTSTASHASQSGILSVNSRLGPPSSSKLTGYERKFSDKRISTVPEANEDELDYNHQHQSGAVSSPRATTSGNLQLGSSASVPRVDPELLMTPPQQQSHIAQYQERQMSEPQLPSQQLQQQLQQTPQSSDKDKVKKHKSGGSTSWLPKISRWSETTTSSVGRVFRSSQNSKKGQDDVSYRSAASRSGSDMGGYDGYADPEGPDQLHTGFSEPNLHHEQFYGSPGPQDGQQVYNMRPGSAELIPPNPKTYMTPEDPKYHAHRNSLNLQHPQPRTGQPFQRTLEFKAHDYDTPMSPHSADWAGSATSLNRFPEQNTNRYSGNSAANAAALAANATTHESQQQYWEASQPSNAQPQAAPPRPPKEPLDDSQSSQLRQQTPPRPARLSKPAMTSPLPYHSVESGYGTATNVPTSYTGSPRLENRNLNSALGVPTRRPSGPRAMTPKSEKSTRSYNEEDSGSESRRRKRDTFGTVASQDIETF